MPLRREPLADQEMRKLLKVIEERLAQADYLAGEYSIADMALWPWIRTLGMFFADDLATPALQRWFSVIETRPAVAAAAARMDTIGKFNRQARREASEEQLDRYFGRVGLVATNQFTAAPRRPIQSLVQGFEQEKQDAEIQDARLQRCRQGRRRGELQQVVQRSAYSRCLPDRRLHQGRSASRTPSMESPAISQFTRWMLRTPPQRSPISRRRPGRTRWS